MDKEKAIIKLVRDKIYFPLKDELYNFAIANEIIRKGKYSKENIITEILKNLDYNLAIKLIEAFKGYIGFTGYEVQELLGITSKERAKWTKRGFLHVSGSYEKKIKEYGNKIIDCFIYDGIQILSLNEKDIEDIRNSIKPTSERQLAAIEKARKKSIDNRTCKMCSKVFKHKSYLNSDKLCGACVEEIERENIRIKAIERRKYWIDNKDKYIILDVETTGLSSEDEIIQIGIIDLNGNIILDQLVKPTQSIPDKVIELHGINDNMVKDSRTWNNVYPVVKDILKNKIIIAYNAAFDVGMILNSCRKYNIEALDMPYECLMYNTMDIWGTDKFISLLKALDLEGINVFQDHRAVSDCYLCLQLINSVLSNY